MQFFTYDWAMGRDDSDAVGAYQSFLATLDPDSAPRRFAETVSLNDAWLDRVMYDAAARTLSVLLLTGDNQSDYWHTELTYDGAILVGLPVLRDALQNRPTEIWYDEFAFRDAGLSHSFLMAPTDMRKARDRQFHIGFSSYAFSRRPAAGRILMTPEDRSVWR